MFERNYDQAAPNWSGIVRVALILAWVLWCCGPFFHAHLPSEHELHARMVESALEQQRFQRYEHVVCSLAGRAQRLGNAYTVDRYISDEKQLTILYKQLGHPHDIEQPGNDGGRQSMHTLMMDNVTRASFSSPTARADFVTKWNRYADWSQVYDPCPSPFAGVTQHEVLRWLKIMPGWYLRTMFLFFLLVLLRIKEREDSVREVLRRDRWRAVRMIALWPLGFFRYPFEVVREVKVETELRRRKRGFGLFRQLTNHERHYVHLVANNPEQYRQWLAQYRRKMVRHSFASALAVTLFWMWFGSALPARAYTRGPTHRIVASLCCGHSPPACLADVALAPQTVTIILPKRARKRPPHSVGTERHRSYAPEPVPLSDVVFDINQLLRLGEQLWNSLQSQRFGALPSV